MANRRTRTRTPVNRRDLLTRASTVFLVHGYEVSTDRLCSEIGISKGGLYHHFRGKRELLLESLDAAGVDRGLDPTALLRVLPLARREAAIASILGRRGAPATAEGNVISEALEYGQKVATVVLDPRPRLLKSPPA